MSDARSFVTMPDYPEFEVEAIEVGDPVVSTWRSIDGTKVFIVFESKAVVFDAATEQTVVFDYANVDWNAPENVDFALMRHESK